MSAERSPTELGSATGEATADVPTADVPTEPTEPTDSTEPIEPTQPTDGRRKVRFALTYLSVFGVISGQQLLTPILAPLSRQVRLSEFQLGLVITVAAALVVVASPFWGRRSELWGRKLVLMISLVGTSISLVAFAVVGTAALAGAIGGVTLLALMMLTRGLGFGATVAAGPVAAQAYLADITTDEAARVRAVAGVGAAQGLALVVGPALGAALGGLSLLLPLYAAPIAIAVVGVAVWVFLPAAPRRSRQAPPRLSPFDARVLPFLLTGFALFTALGMVQVTLGFLLQDRLVLTAAETASRTGIAIAVAGVIFLVAQAALVPKLRWSPLRLMRVGVPISGLAMVLLLPDLGFAPILVSMVFLGLGLGLAVPGYSAAPTLLVEDNEQGGVAGLIFATNGLAFVAAPLISTALYELLPIAPYLFGAVALVGLTVFVVFHPSVRRVRGVRQVRGG